MSHAKLSDALEAVGDRLRTVRLWLVLTLCWLAWALLALVAVAAVTVLGIDQASAFAALLALGTAALITGLVAILWTSQTFREPLEVARRIEQTHPDLATGLLAATEQVRTEAEGPVGYLQARLVNDAMGHYLAHDWTRTVPGRSIRSVRRAHWASLLAMVAGFVLLGASAGQSDLERSTEGGRFPEIAFGDVLVEPGDIELERGRALLVVARFAEDAVAGATLVVETPDGTITRKAMTRSLDDPAFAARVSQIDADLDYRIEYGTTSSRDFHVDVFEYPEAKRFDASLDYPSYTHQVPRVIEDVRQVTAVEGTELTLDVRLNKPVRSARLITEGTGSAIALEPKADDDSVYATALQLDRSRRYRLELVDDRGRRNRIPTEFRVNVTRNEPPSIALTWPGRDVEVSPLEEFALDAEVADDYGLVRFGISYAFAGQPTEEIVLSGDGEGSPEDTRLTAEQIEHLIALETLDAQPDQLLSYHAWAEDIGPDEQPRRTAGDLFFAEVRPFDQIFRQGEQPPGGAMPQQQGGGGNAQQADELVQLQKQVINATWNQLRDFSDGSLSADARGNLETIGEAQGAVIVQAEGLAGELEDEASQESLQRALDAMNQAVEALERAHDPVEAGRESLDQAIGSEQAAYQALLELRAREFEVTRQQQGAQSGSASGGGNRMQRQLDQLELDNQENRYETRRAADQRSLRDQQQRETQEVLNRLRELARRQQDINERLNELQAGLKAAETPEQREEIERQLKRLREQQQQMLRDLENLTERMQSEQNRDRMAEQREQLEQSRENARRASEALEQGQLSQAITEGARAGQRLSELRDQMREQAANQFADEMTEMTREARQLTETQRELGEQLEDLNTQASRSLRDDGQRDRVVDELDRQRDRVEELLERIRETVEQAQVTEPRLAEDLFESAQQASQDRIADALEESRRLAEAGIVGEADRISGIAQEGLDRLQEGIERAAESVLGDETEALRLARSELDDLTERIDRELDRLDPPSSDRNDQEGRGQPGSESGRGSNPDNSDTANPNDASGRSRTDSEEEPGDSPGESERSGDSSSDRPEDRPPGESPSGSSTDRSRDPSDSGTGSGQSESSETSMPGESGSEGSESSGSGRGSPDSQEASESEGSEGEGGSSSGGLRGGNDARSPRIGNPGSLLNRFLGGSDGNGGGGAANPGGPITGGDYLEWSERMRDVEDLLDDPELRAEVARIRDRVRAERLEFRRHSRMPDPEKLRELVAEPLAELRDRVAEELLRLERPDALVPIDREPVPPEYADGVRRYYERLGSGR